LYVKNRGSYLALCHPGKASPGKESANVDNRVCIYGGKARSENI